MSKPQRVRRRHMSYDEACALLVQAEAKAQAESYEYQRAYEAAIVCLHDLYAVMAGERAKALLARREVNALRAIVDAGDGKRDTVRELVPNPLITQGLLDAVEDGEVETPHSPHVMVDKNMALLVGGLSRVKNKTEAHVLAAIRYCNLYEKSQIGGARATDYSQVRVDTSGPCPDPVSDRQDDCRRQLTDAEIALGPSRARIIEYVVVYGNSVRGLSKHIGLGEGGQGRRKAERALLDALDVLVEHFKLMPASVVRVSHWSDGSRANVLRMSEEAGQ